MTDAEVRAFLAERPVALVAGQGPDGLTARRATLDLDGDLLCLRLVPAERCFDLDRQPGVCVTVDVYPSYAEIRGVIVQGSARWVGDADLEVTLDDVVSFDFTKARA